MPFDPDFDTDWERDLEREEFRRRPRGFRCSDGYCGQLDCNRCHPENEIINPLE